MEGAWVVLPDASFKLPEKWKCIHLHTTMYLMAGPLLGMTRNIVIMSNMGTSPQSVSFSDQALTNSIACPES